MVLGLGAQGLKRGVHLGDESGVKHRKPLHPAPPMPRHLHGDVHVLLHWDLNDLVLQGAGVCGVCVGGEGLRSEPTEKHTDSHESPSADPSHISSVLVLDLRHFHLPQETDRDTVRWWPMARLAGLEGSRRVARLCELL